MTTVTDIDPRLRARRGAVHRAEGRRRLRFILLGLALVGLILCGWAALRSPLLDLDHVEMTGLEPSQLMEVQRTVGLEEGTPLSDIETGLIKAELEALPWVLGAEVRKSWPGTVQIEVIERTAVAQLSDQNGRIALIDATGTVMAEGGTNNGALPRISLDTSVELGEIEPEALPGLALIAALPDDLLAWVEAITHSPGPNSQARGSVGLELVGEAQAYLGEATLLDDKVQALRSVLEGVDLTCIRVIDVAVPDFPTVRRDSACSASAGIG